LGRIVGEAKGLALQALRDRLRQEVGAGSVSVQIEGRAVHIATDNQRLSFLNVNLLNPVPAMQQLWDLALEVAKR
jgi:hypothetical protein